jgi:hypothetical protein
MGEKGKRFWGEKGKGEKGEEEQRLNKPDGFITRYVLDSIVLILTLDRLS